MQSAGVSLLSNAAATGSWVDWPGGTGHFTAEATWGGGTVGLEYMGANGTAIAPAGGSLSANGGFVFDLPPGKIRAAVATATAVYARADRVPV